MSQSISYHSKHALRTRVILALLVIGCLSILSCTHVSATSWHYRVLDANLHVHSNISDKISRHAKPDHALAGWPDDVMADGAACGLDVIGFSDHGGKINRDVTSSSYDEWLYLGYISRTGGPAAIRGFEWTGEHHVNVFGTSTFCDVTNWGTAGDPEPAMLGRDGLANLGAWLCSHSGEHPVAQFNHLWSGSGFSNFTWPGGVNQDELDSIFCLGEIGGSDAVILLSATSHIRNDEALRRGVDRWRQALSVGWHLGPSIGHDNFGRLNWRSASYHTGICVDPSLLGNERAAVMEALRNRRVYASTDKNAEIRFSALADGASDSHPMGSRFTCRSGTSVTFEVIANRTGDLSLWSPTRGNPVRSACWNGKINCSWTMSYQELTSLPRVGRSNEVCIYAEIVEPNGDHIYSSPIWISFSSASDGGGGYTTPGGYSGPTSYSGCGFVSDVTVPDDTVMQRGQAFTKTWRLRNTGTTTWGSGYRLAFVSGYQLGAPDYVDAPNVGSQRTWDVSATMSAPWWPGTYTGYWQMRTSSGRFFGPKIWVRIIVSGDLLPPPALPEGVHIQYASYIQDWAWDYWASDGQVSGNLDDRKIEAVVLRSPGRHVSYRAHCQDIGWQNWVQDGAVAGTVGQSRRLEAIQATIDSGSIAYQTCVEGIGWTPWVFDGGTSGTIGESRMLLAIRSMVWETRLSITAITPDTAPNDGSYIQIHVIGTGFSNQATLKLTRTGQTDVPAQSVNRLSATDICCTFDLTGKMVGRWNLQLDNADGRIITVPNGFIVSEPVSSRNCDMVLFNGDVNGDNTINLTDQSIMMYYWNTRSGDEGWNPDCDLNGDNYVDGNDFSILQRNWGMNGSTPFPTTYQSTPGYGDYEIRGRISLLDWSGAKQNVNVEAVLASSETVLKATGLSDQDFAMLVPDDGEYTVKAKASHWLRNMKSRVQSIALPKAYALTPNVWQNNSSTGLIHITGQGFQQDAAVRLKLTGQADIQASHTRTVDSKNIYCAFDLTGKQAGVWDVVVTNPDSRSFTLAGAFTISPRQQGNSFTLALVNGDANNDNLIDLSDFSILMYYWEAVPGSDTWNENVDFDGDDSVGTKDYRVMLEGWGMAGAQAPAQNTERMPFGGCYEIAGRVDLGEWPGNKFPIQIEAQAANDTSVYAGEVHCGQDFRIRVPLPGVYTVTAKAEHWLRSQAQVVASLAPDPQSITPTSISNSGSAAVEIRGAGFENGATVILKKGDQSRSAAVRSAATTDSLIVCDCDVFGAAPGAWDIEVRNPGGGTGLLQGGLTVTDDSPSVTIEQASSQSDPTSSPTVEFAVIFSQPVTGFSPDGVSVVCTSDSETNVSVVGQGSIYLVTISGLTSSGAVAASVKPGSAHNSAGLPNLASSSLDNEVLYLANPSSISTAKTWADGQQLSLLSKAVTAVFGDCIYVSDGLVSGIQVQSLAPLDGIREGALVSIIGELQTTGAGERYILGDIYAK